MAVLELRCWFLVAVIYNGCMVELLDARHDGSRSSADDSFGQNYGGSLLARVLTGRAGDLAGGTVERVRHGAGRAAYRQTGGGRAARQGGSYYGPPDSLASGDGDVRPEKEDFMTRPTVLPGYEDKPSNVDKLNTNDVLKNNAEKVTNSGHKIQHPQTYITGTVHKEPGDRSTSGGTSSSGSTSSTRHTVNRGRRPHVITMVHNINVGRNPSGRASSAGNDGSEENTQHVKIITHNPKQDSDDVSGSNLMRAIKDRFKMEDLVNKNMMTMMKFLLKTVSEHTDEISGLRHVISGLQAELESVKESQQAPPPFIETLPITSNDTDDDAFNRIYGETLNGRVAVLENQLAKETLEKQRLREEVETLRKNQLDFDTRLLESEGAVRNISGQFRVIAKSVNTLVQQGNETIGILGTMNNGGMNPEVTSVLEQMRKNVTILGDELVNLVEQILVGRDEIQEVDEKLDSIDEFFQNFTGEINTFTDEVYDLSERTFRTEEELGNATFDIYFLKEDVAGLKSKTVANNDFLWRHEDRLTSLSSSISDLKDEVEKKEEETRDYFDKKITTLDDVIDENTKTILQIGRVQESVANELVSVAETTRNNDQTLRDHEAILNRVAMDQNLQRKTLDAQGGALNDVIDIVRDMNLGLPTAVAKDCADVYKFGQRQNGVYSIQPEGSPEVTQVFCDMETEDGGWTVIQRRGNGTVDFYRTWEEYKAGFGSPHTEYWLGNELLHLLTDQGEYEMRIDLEDWVGMAVYAKYSTVYVSDEGNSYRIRLGEYSGDAGDGLRLGDRRRFSTKDKDHDRWEEGECAKYSKGGWWFAWCTSANLNGVYRHTGPYDGDLNGVYWYPWKGTRYSLRKVSMKIRPKEFNQKPSERELGDYWPEEDQAVNTNGGLTRNPRWKIDEGPHGGFQEDEPIDSSEDYPEDYMFGDQFRGPDFPLETKSDRHQIQSGPDQDLAGKRERVWSKEESFEDPDSFRGPDFPVNGFGWDRAGSYDVGPNRDLLPTHKGGHRDDFEDD
ncbi:uncharacterized protein LOC118404530 [Branchiostoma floridae]|uniref:Uncharacterized protein LOC118404530 n=2 Tax=Branchiostoma floridae TaxID=7739 RepID=A0A9J7HK50_BRAFL|nr:uncharacterized protein LOC118404530 [Branchiostoma floridae]